MSDRAQQLYETADRQIAGVIELVSNVDQSMMRRPCGGREKLGDGTVAASAQHTADNYQRIAAFIQTSDRMSATHSGTKPGGHSIPRFMRALGHRPPEHADHGPGGGHGEPYSADRVSQPELITQLGTTRASLRNIADLTDMQLDSIPPDGSFRFCDGKRSLHQVLEGLLKHQDHQISALRTATT
jgi:hypothetical protein